MYVCKLSEKPSVKVSHENKQEYQVCKIFTHLADYWILSHVKRQHFCEPLWSQQTGLCSQLVSPPFEGTARVTGLDEFSPVGWLFTLGSFCETYKYSTDNWATFVHGKSCVPIFTRNGLGYILGDFSQGHLVALSEKLSTYAVLPFDFAFVSFFHSKISFEASQTRVARWHAYFRTKNPDLGKLWRVLQCWYIICPLCLFLAT
jgi:hypothetical protein